ncbi:helix-turn-helix transcriptional regulator [Crossiella sp. SN42]|uniref:helix-turn-helix transcriptional regulator n=1 Tax=Crossiella sp. SN42 TaxID=2944808 RepID=UPI00207C7C70|nr:PAS domain-containing protein [Crossiella sp. SN42]MCO1578478.1 helix-turn-helix transcriptional regulator [Crossiella sp. SN42]
MSTTVEADDLFESVRPLVAGLAATYGPTAEIVLHDYRNPEASVVAISGAVTNRHVGGAMSEIGLGLLAAGPEAEDRLNYLTRLPDGRLVRSSTMLLRLRGQVVGALCVNLDVTALRQAADTLTAMAGPLEPAPVTVFSDDVDQVVDAVIAEEGGCDRADRADRRRIIAALDRRGVFAVQRSAARVAEHLGISRATLYNDLARVRAR